MHKKNYFLIVDYFNYSRLDNLFRIGQEIGKADVKHFILFQAHINVNAISK